jgi:predicted nucleotidyltransferase
VKQAIARATGVEAVVQFGSTARGDSDKYSDRDICAIVTDLPDRRIGVLKRRVAKLYDTDAQSLSAYRLSTIRHMARSGSLFLWHLKREGRVLYERRGAMKRTLRGLHQYRRYSEDLLRFQEVFDDTVHQFNDRGQLDLFDLHALFLVVRNVCMLLTVKAGDPCFGRVTVYRGAVRQYGRIPVTGRVFDQLARGHLVYLRGAAVQVLIPSPEAATAILAQVSRLLKLAWRRFE